VFLDLYDEVNRVMGKIWVIGEDRKGRDSMTWLKIIYKHAPYRIRQLMANVEAIRRRRIRNGGDYRRYYKEIDIETMLTENQPEKQLNRLNRLLAHSKKSIPYYREALPMESIQFMDELSAIPFLTKDAIREEGSQMINPQPKVGLWKGWTSGTTGSSLVFYRDKQTMQYEYALYDRLYEYVTGGIDRKIARLSNIPIAAPEVKHPPYWFVIHPFHQLQCSIDHVDGNTYGDYLQAMLDYKVDLGTGYGFSWYLLAESMLANKDQRLSLQGIVTDSEGLTDEQRAVVEEAFSCPVYQTYGTSEVGLVAVQCKEGHYHILDRCLVEVIDENGKVLEEGEEGELAITDLLSMDAPYIRYRPGDMGIVRNSGCACGWNNSYIEELAGRVEDYLVTALDRKVRRIGRLTKDVKGIVAMQIIQDVPGEFHVRLIPKPDFTPEYMEKMRQNCREFLGEMTITWEKVSELERAPSGKVKYLIRRF
jgi:phenylacetate-CoA ligase